MIRRFLIARVALIVVSVALSATLFAQDDDIRYEPGITLRVFDVGARLSALPELIEAQTPNHDVLAKTIDFGDDDFGGHDDQFYVTVTGRLRCERAGRHMFRLTSDDGSVLHLAGRRVIDHDGLHGANPKVGGTKLTTGHHDLEIRHFENGGGAMLRLEWKPPGAKSWALVPTANLSTRKGVVRVTSPGRKKVLRSRMRRPAGDGRPLREVHPSYDLFTCRPDDFRPRVGGLDFLPDGRLVVCAWETPGGVYLVDGVHGDDRSALTVKRIARGLAEPLGMAVVGERIFVLQKQELTELIDHDGDDVTNEYRCVSDDWNVTANFHEFAFGLVEKDGWLYFNLAIAIDPGGKSTNPQAPNRGRTVRVRIDDGRREFVAWGLRTPNGIGLGLNGDIYITDNQGDWLPASKLVRFEHDAWFGSRAALPYPWNRSEDDVTPPVVWLPQNEIGNSPGEPTYFPTGPFRGQLAVCDVTHGGIKRVFVETVSGTQQGTVFRFTQGLEAGTNRLKIRPDGTIFTGGVGSTGNWNQSGKAWHGLQRLRPNAAVTFEARAIRTKSNGFEIEFTEPLAATALPDPSAWRGSHWRYVPTENYGGPKIDETAFVAKSISVSADGRRVFLELDDDVEADRVYHLRLPSVLRSHASRALWSPESWTTVNVVPIEPGTTWPPRTVHAANTLTDAERAAGWKLLFDGTSTTAFRGFRREAFPTKGWIVRDGEIIHAKGGGGGDIVTHDAFENFEFACEWNAAPGANSGITYLVTEDYDAPWRTGPEMQILDDARHPDGRNPLTSAGALYALKRCRRNVVRPAGEWNHARVKIENGVVEHWLNGIRVVRCDLRGKEFDTLVADSKFSTMPGFGKNRSGHVALQDHGDEVRFRNVKIRRLP